MKRKLNSIWQLFFMVTILIGIGHSLYAEYRFHSDQIVLSVEDNFEESVFVFDIDFVEEDQMKHPVENNIIIMSNLENYHFRNSFLMLNASFIIWQPPKNFA